LVEGVGNHSWGLKDSGRINVKTGGKEKNQLTVVLTIARDGTKGIPFIIFKGISVCLSNSLPRTLNLLTL